MRLQLCCRSWWPAQLLLLPKSKSQNWFSGRSSSKGLTSLSKWLREYQAWERWFEQWGNRVARNFNDQLIWERKKRPEPPVWLEAECQGYFGADDMLASACYILRNWDDQPLLILQRRSPSLVTSGGKVDDKVVKSSFFQRVHVTGLWMQARYPATPALRHCWDADRSVRDGTIHAACYGVMV